MKIVKFKGGLGNQLFQYVFLKALQCKCPDEIVKADFSYYTNIKNDQIRVPRIKELSVNLNEASQDDLRRILIFKHTGNPQGLFYKGKVFFEKTINRRYFFESDRNYRPLDGIIHHEYFDGYWQSWRYFDGLVYITI